MRRASNSTALAAIVLALGLYRSADAATLQTAVRIPLSCTEGQVHAHCMSGEERVRSKSCLSVEGTSGSCLFLQRDPSGYEDSVNVYAGLANDPINHRDPTGAFVVPVAWLIGAAVVDAGLLGYIGLDDDVRSSVGAKLGDARYWAGAGFGAAQAIIPFAGFFDSPYPANSLEEAGRREAAFGVGFASIAVSLPNLIALGDDLLRPPPQPAFGVATGAARVQAAALSQAATDLRPPLVGINGAAGILAESNGGEGGHDEVASSSSPFRTVIDEGGAKLLEANTSSGRKLEFMFEEVIEGTTLIMRRAHVDGASPGAVGIGEMKELLRLYGRERGVKRIVVEAARRSTGRMKGKVPRPWEIDID